MTDNTLPLYCSDHPNTETTLRCNRCDKPICPRCAILTPTGYRCKDCVKGQQKIFNTAEWYDYLTIAVVSLVLSYIGSRFVPFIGFFTIFLAPIVGVIIAEADRFVSGRRRSKRLYQLAAIATVLGSLPLLLTLLLHAIAQLSMGGFGILLPLLWQALYTITVTSTMYYRLSGISIGRR